MHSMLFFALKQISTSLFHVNRSTFTYLTSVSEEFIASTRRLAASSSCNIEFADYRRNVMFLPTLIHQNIHDHILLKTAYSSAQFFLMLTSALLSRHVLLSLGPHFTLTDP